MRDGGDRPDLPECPRQMLGFIREYAWALAVGVGVGYQTDSLAVELSLVVVIIVLVNWRHYAVRK